jgi:SAM-dependent methyltransferase
MYLEAQMDPKLYREMAETQQKHWWFRARREILARVIARLGLPSHAELLEIGAGTGGNLGMLRKYGRVSAVEVDSFASRYASDLSGLNVSYGCLPDPLPFADASFDLVCLFDVLEHVQDDTNALRRVHQLLKPGGRAVITVPAYQWLYGAHDRAHHHFRRYTARQLYLKARDAGLRVGRKGYFNALLFPLIALHRLLRMATAQEDQHDAAVPSRLANGLLYAIFAAEKYIVPLALFPYGTSVLAVLERHDPRA